MGSRQSAAVSGQRAISSRVAKVELCIRVAKAQGAMANNARQENLNLQFDFNRLVSSTVR